jgi:hypothetical protein
LFLGTVEVSAQKDSISIEARLSSDKKVLDVSQELVYHNHSGKKLDTVKLLNWVSAYHRRGTSLVYRKLEDRNTDLHFAKKEELGKLISLEIKNAGHTIPVSPVVDENLLLPLQEELAPGEKVKLQLHYQIQLPARKFTGYGTSDTQVALKYFFIVPDHFDPDNNSPRNYADIEESVNFNTFWTVNFDLPVNYFIESNLQQIQMNSFKGYLDSASIPK